LLTPARRAAIGCLLALAAAGLLEAAPLPWIWIGLGAFVLLALAASRTRRDSWRLLWLLAAAIVLAPVLAEAWLAAHEYERFEGYERRDYFRDDDVLGYALRPDQQVHSRRVVGGKTVYDVVYTIDGRGLRVEPPLAPGHGDGCVLFFGGSYTFGEGVNDTETLPYRSGVRAEGRLRMINFGLHGYGAHQMLAALEGGVVDEALDGCEPVLAVYQGVWFHAFRPAGRESWDRHGPRYVLDPEGELIRRGHFDDDLRLRAHQVALERLRRSYLFRAISAPRRRPSSSENALYVAIVERARAVVETRWPRARFHVLYWDVPRHPIEAAFEARGLRVHRVSGILPAWYQHRDRYTIPRDGHPNALADDGLAEYLVREILGRDPEQVPPPR
jgi:hypothetical protein